MNPDQSSHTQFLAIFEGISRPVINEIRLCRYQSMLAKYHLLLQRESTRLASSSEEVMLARFWDSEERQNIAKEKEEFQNGAVHELPPLPDEWSAKYEEIYGEKPPSGVVPEIIKPEVDDQEDLMNQEFMMSQDVKPQIETAGAGDMVVGMKSPPQQDDDDQIKQEDEEVIVLLIYVLRPYRL